MKTVAVLAVVLAAALIMFADEPAQPQPVVKTYVSYTNRVSNLPDVRIGRIRWADGTSQTGFDLSGRAPLAAVQSGKAVELKDIVTGAVVKLCVSNGVPVVVQ